MTSSHQLGHQSGHQSGGLCNQSRRLDNRY